MSDEKVIAQFGNRLRTRVCGICIESNKILMVKHKNLGETHLWAPPGGGVHYAERLEQALQREFLEETQLEIELEHFLFTHEFLAPPLHAVELFFKVRITGGQLSKGIDPELKDDQIIEQVSFQKFETIKEDLDANIHPALRKINTLEELLDMQGLYSFYGD